MSKINIFWLCKMKESLMGREDGYRVLVCFPPRWSRQIATWYNVKGKARSAFSLLSIYWCLEYFYSLNVRTEVKSKYNWKKNPHSKLLLIIYTFEWMSDGDKKRNLRMLSDWYEWGEKLLRWTRTKKRLRMGNCWMERKFFVHNFAQSKLTN